MRKLKNLLTVIVLGAMSIVTLMNPITVSAAGNYQAYVDYAPSGEYKHKILINDPDLGQKDIVGYCFNAHKVWPSWSQKYYYKYSNATQDQFLTLASTPNGGQDLKKRIMEVCYKGYPNDSIGLKKKYGLSTDQFNFVTQLAIWYYTDSISPRNSAIFSTYAGLWNENVEKAYNDIISKPVNLPNNYFLDLFYKENNATSTLQNVLSTRLNKDYTNIESEKIKKVVVKKTWEMYGHDESEKPNSVQVQLYEDGQLYQTVDLTKDNGWTYTWDALPASGTYTAKELTEGNWVNRVENYDEATGTINIYNSMKPELVIKNEVQGKLGDRSKEFSFDLTLTDEGGTPLNGEYPYVKLNPDGTEASSRNLKVQNGEASSGNLKVQNGKATFKLSDSQTITLKDLPPKVHYIVSEVNDDEYITKYYKGKQGETLVNGQNAEGTITNDNLDNNVKVVNVCKKQFIPPTGIRLNNMPFVLMAAFGLIASVGYALTKRRFTKR